MKFFAFFGPPYFSVFLLHKTICFILGPVAFDLIVKDLPLCLAIDSVAITLFRSRNVRGLVGGCAARPARTE